METKIDVIRGGTGYGGVAEKLLQNNMDVSSLRTNAVLTYDEWKDIDTVVLQEAHRRVGGVNDLISRGLVRTGGGLGSTARRDMRSGYYPSDMGMRGGTMYKKGGRVKSMGIAKRGGGVAKR